MNTLLLHKTEHDIETAAGIIRQGGLVAMPTETVYGLSADALNGKSVKKIFEAKGRPADNPLIVHIASLSDIERLRLTPDFPEKAKRLSDAFWPGPLTVIVRKGDVIPDEVSAGLDTVALRMPSHPVARQLIEKSGCALAAPSANSSGLPSPTTAGHVMDDLSGKIDAVIDGGECEVGVESTVITLVTNPPRILRPGYITKEDIERVIGKIEVDPAVIHQAAENARVSSPGMKYRHYSPKARVVLVEADDERFIRFVNKSYEEDPSVAALCYVGDIGSLLAPTVSLGKKDDLKEQARRLFDALRAVDHIEGVKTVYAHCPTAQGVGMALYNRLIRAAAFEVIRIPKIRIIGLTGQTGAGKSEVARLLKEQGMAVIDADQAARQAVEDPVVLRKLTEVFSDEILLPDGSLDRKKTASLVFSDETQRARLNAITHPKIISIMLDEARKAAEDGRTIALFDAPQLFEAHGDRFCEHIICVLSDEEARLDRVMRRDSLSREEALLRMRAQLSEDFFRTHCDLVIENNGSFELLQAQTQRIAEVLYGGLL